MKNQYVGDIGDYGKYSLLRFLAQQGIRIGVNWYLTENDRSEDGKFIKYLENDSEKIYDQDVFWALKKIVDEHDKDHRKVRMIQDIELIPKTVFFDEPLDETQKSPMERAWKRRIWFEDSQAALAEAELIFADPDNGISYTKTSRKKGSEKYILPEEAAQYYYSGKDVVYYCHKGRRSSDKWNLAKAKIIEYICDARLLALTFHRGTQRSYIFVVHPERIEMYESLLQGFLSTSWGKSEVFTNETVKQYKTDKTEPDLCRRWAMIDSFQKAFPTKQEKETALTRMTNEQIDKLIEASMIVQGKIFCASFKGTGFAAPTIGTLHPKGATLIYNDDGTVTVVSPSDLEERSGNNSQ